VQQTERAIREAMSVSRGASEVLNIGKSAYTDPYLVTTVQSIRLPLYPDLTIRLCSHYSHELARMVATGEIDMALVTAIPDLPALDFLTLTEQPMYLVLSKASPLARLHELTLEDLRGCEWILLAPQVSPYVSARLNQAAAKTGIASADIHTVMTAEESSGLILERDAVAFLPRDAAWRIASDGITIRPLVKSGLDLVTRLATLAKNRSRLTSEFVRAIGRKQNSLYPPPLQQSLF